jgi:hypothetical protein
MSMLSQKLIRPNFALASHPMKVIKISHTTNETIIELSIENQIEYGSFCADKNIYVQDVLTGKKHYLTKSEGIPVCPDVHEFLFIGEVLYFSLHFPKINTGKYITLVEDCDEYCFSINGIVLDGEMNTDINLGYSYYAKGNLDAALEAFKSITEKHSDYPFGLYYLNIIQIYSEKNDFKAAKTWFKKIKDSQFKDKEELIRRLKQQSYYSQLL